MEEFPFPIHTVITDNGKEFTDAFAPGRKGKPSGKHIFDVVCMKNSIQHRLIKVKTPRTNEMVERAIDKLQDRVLLQYRAISIDDLFAQITKFAWCCHFIPHSSLKCLQLKN